MAFLGPTTLSPIAANPPSLNPGRTILAIGVSNIAATANYNTPYLVTDMYSAANYFGYDQQGFTRALGEMIRQGAGSIIAVPIAQPADLAPILQTIMDIPFDILHPVGVPATSASTSMLGQFALQRMQIGLPIVTVQAATGTTNQLLASACGIWAGKIQYSNYPNQSLGSSFCFCPDTIVVNPDIPSNYSTNAAASVAGLMSRYAPIISISNKSMNGISLPTQYTQTTAQNLASAGYLTLRNFIRAGVAPYLAVTGTSNNPASANYSNSFHNVATIRVANFVERELRASLNPQVGESINTDLRTIATNTLKQMKANGTILDYDYTYQMMAVSGVATLNVAILTTFETQWVQLQILVNVRK